MARIPKNELFDMILAFFDEQPRWSLKVLRERCQQPEVYLKEVLAEVALLNRSGEYCGMWELKETFKDPSPSVSRLLL
ncbi:transcription initiation factor IIF, beta subunit [Coprinopsis sp. MPI-PUGE-AT-0042]|nr:transcription initiation factor IIF, beta subunit [Coprinopsis sp. MPI-PUGE-AT-0042]